MGTLPISAAIVNPNYRPGLLQGIAVGFRGRTGLVAHGGKLRMRCCCILKEREKVWKKGLKDFYDYANWSFLDFDAAGCD